MKKSIILALGCALIAPLAFAQTSTSTSETTTTTTGTSKTVPSSSSSTTETTTSKVAPVASSSQTTTTTTSTDGTVSTFEPGSRIVVRRVGVTDPISYTLGKTVQYVNRAGKTIEASVIRPGVPVHVYYDNGTGSSTTVTKVVVDQD